MQAEIKQDNLTQCVEALLAEQVIAYPTEGVFGVGCDPDSAVAIARLLQIKQRDKAKGLILIAATLEQLDGYVDFAPLTESAKKQVLATWPGPVTWIMPAGEKISAWISGAHDSVAVRVSDHPQVKALCLAFGKPITSTSANLSGFPPCRSALEVKNQVGTSIAAILDGNLGARDKPTAIWDARTGKMLRQG